MDDLSKLIILRALFMFFLIDKGWIVKKQKGVNTFKVYKNVKKNINL